MSEVITYQGVSKFNPRGSKKLTLLVFICIFGIIGGIIALFISNAAVPLIVDSSVPQPQNVRAYPDDKNIIVSWDDNRPQGVVGYYVTYKKKGASTVEGVKQTIHASTQLQPLANNQEYEITVQAARGSYQATPRGDLVANDNSDTMYWARADGHVSPISASTTVSATTTGARTAAMSNRLTGFFDGFDEPANPFNELKWNNAAFCEQNQTTASAFINTQFHSHNSIYCGFGGTVSRPRAIFDTNYGLNGGAVSESNPAQIEFDMDFTYDGRSKWYLDLIPLSSRRDGSVLDIDGHHSPDDTQDHEDPGNMLRLEVPGHGYGYGVTYWDTNRNFRQLNLFDRPIACGDWNHDGAVDFRAGCDMNSKTLTQSPNMAEPTISPLRGAQNVRRHWVMQITPTKMKIFLDGTLIGDTNLPADWSAQKKYVLQNTMFSYNTGKQFGTSTDEMGHRGIVPGTNLYHWDNFGFTGPAATTVVHNYIDGGADGLTPRYLNNRGPNQNNRTTIFPVPDEIGNPLNNRGKLYFSIMSNNGTYKWAQGDHVMFNGVRYELPNPVNNMVNPPPQYSSEGLWAAIVTVAIDINKNDIRRGNNTVTFNLPGSANGGLATNAHLELEYSKSGTIPAFTQPISIYGQNLSNVVEPNMTNCDAYIYVEQDIGLPYLNGKTNMEPGPCVYLNVTPHHEGVGVLLDMRDFEAEEAHSVTPQITTVDDPSASNGKYIRF